MADKLDELVRLLDQAESSETVVTSLRQPTALRAALRLAVAMGMDGTPNEATNRALVDRLNAFAQRQGLERHFREHPAARPPLVEVARQLAALDGNPLAERPDLLAQAADELESRRPEATAEDMLLWAESLLVHGWAAADRAGQPTTGPR